jgi:superfamily II DNA or RNA helicase
MKYPEISDEEFYEKINKIYKKYTIKKKPKTFEQICFPKHFNLQLPQQFVSNFINPKTPYKSLLLYHNIGSGKSCSAIRIAEEWKYYRNIVVVVPASLKGNFRNELRSQCAGNSYLSEKNRELLSKLHPSSQEYKDIIEASDKKIDKYYQIYSYNKFVELVQNKETKLHNTLLIVDEVHNMVSEEGTYYENLYKIIHNAPEGLRTVILSATPMFDKPSEFALTLNLLRLPEELPTGAAFLKKFIKIRNIKDNYIYSVKNLDFFKEKIKGFVSYFRGAPPYVFPEMKIKYVRCPMSEFQYNAYKTVLRNEEKEHNLSRLQLKKKIAYKALTVNDLPNNFFIGTRMVSTVVFPNKKINEDGFDSFKGKYITEKLHNYSTKFAAIYNKISKSSGKVYVYSAFKEYGGIKSFVRVLEEFGYLDYTKNGEGYHRFAVWSGDEDQKLREEIKAVYNQKSNLNGSKLKILILSPAATAGISLLGVRQAHILEPTWNWSKMQQIIGRGSRFCSHKDLPEEKRKIKVYIYLAVRPEYDEDLEETVDEYISDMAKQKNKLILQFEQAVKEMAVDCKINKNANAFGEEKIDCQK